MRVAWISPSPWLGCLVFGLVLLGCPGPTNPGVIDADDDGAPANVDCDDTDPDIAPGKLERCDGKDNDCSGLVDDDAADATDWFKDVDGDGYGDADIRIRSCTSPGDDFVDNGDDCNDLFENSYPGADEICDGNDNDCDTEVDEDPVDPVTWYRDEDGDGFGTAEDTIAACSPPVGYVAGPGDCDDTDEDQNPRAAEICNDEDDDCDEQVDEEAIDASEQYVDADRDGHGSPDRPPITACTPPEGYASVADDCDDSESAVYPGATEICDGLDNDCDGSSPEEGLISADGTNQPDIDAALGAAATGGTVAVCAGDWSVALEIDKDLTLTGPQGADLTTLRPAAADTPILRVTSGAVVTVSGLTLADGDAPTGGAIDSRDGADLAIRDCSFVANAAEDGGAIAANTASTTTITSSTFSSNVATDRGGALLAGEVTIETSTFTGNAAATGGAIYLDGGSATLDADTLIEKNEATLDGGGIAVSGANGVTGGIIADNEAGRNGGGVWLDDGASITKSELDRNLATSDGGGVYVSGAGVLETLFVFDNLATRGAGVATTDGDVDISACELSRNIAVDEGGGISALGSGAIAFTGGIVSANEATTGGGAWLADGTFESIGSDWGTSSLDNDPDDVVVSGGDTYDSYGASASFTCTVSDGTCS